jgi:hypothetical protein
LAVAAVLAVSGCQLTGGQQGGGRAAGGGDQPRAAGGEDRSGAEATGQSGPLPPADTKGTSASSNTSDGEDRVRVTLTSLTRQRDLAVLNFTATVLKTDKALGWQVSDFFGDTGAPGGTGLAVNGVYLLDTKNNKRHLVATDSNGRCVCSSNLAATFVQTGQTVVLSATFAAPPGDVGSVHVHVPHAGTFRDVPVR